jgi:hypothetical protein
MAAPTVGLTVIKRFTYRGDASEEWSNHYLLTGATPGSSAEWRTLFDALVAQEKTVFLSTSSVVAGYGYDSASPDATAVWTVDLTVTPNVPVPGTMSGGGNVASGDQACWVRWGLNRLNSKGKRIYLRKYFHDFMLSTTQRDQLYAGQITALTAFGTKMRDGSFVDGRKITDHTGADVIGSGISPWVTTRTLKRRGKRPPS